MNFFAENKQLVFEKLSEDYEEFQKPSSIKFNESGTKEKKLTPADSKKLPFPFNLFGSIKVKEKINYVDLFKDFNAGSKWKERLKKTAAFKKASLVKKEQEKMVYDKCLILKKNLKSLNGLKGKRSQRRMYRSTDLKTSMNKKIFRQTAHTFRQPHLSENSKLVKKVDSNRLSKESRRNQDGLSEMSSHSNEIQVCRDAACSYRSKGKNLSMKRAQSLGRFQKKNDFYVTTSGFPLRQSPNGSKKKLKAPSKERQTKTFHRKNGNSKSLTHTQFICKNIPYISLGKNRKALNIETVSKESCSQTTIINSIGKRSRENLGNLKNFKINELSATFNSGTSTKHTQSQHKKTKSKGGSFTIRPIMSITATKFFEKMRASNPQIMRKPNPKISRLTDTWKKSFNSQDKMTTIPGVEVPMWFDRTKNSLSTLDNFIATNDLTELNKIESAKIVGQKATNSYFPKDQSVRIQNKQLIIASVKYFKKNKNRISKVVQTNKRHGNGNFLGNKGLLPSSTSNLLKCKKI